MGIAAIVRGPDARKQTVCERHHSDEKNKRNICRGMKLVLLRTVEIVFDDLLVLHAGELPTKVALLRRKNPQST
jgi:hypothetical protein